jgi:AMP deaminase
MANPVHQQQDSHQSLATNLEIPPILPTPRSSESSKQAFAGSSASVISNESTISPYQPFPAQSARIPSQIHLDGHAALGSPILQSVRHDRNAAASPKVGIGREGTWGASGGLEGFADLHLSASEPRIFPGLVSGRQGRGSTRQGSGHEADDGGISMGSGSANGNGKGKSKFGSELTEEDEDEEEVESDAGSN